MSENKNLKWNRAKYFARKKSTSRKVGHPVFVYGRRKNYRKYLTFTHTPEKGKEENYEQLLHNIDPDDNKPCYVKKFYGVSKSDSLIEPDKNYRIHDEDKELVKKYKK